jgi:hypothetical protein
LNLIGVETNQELAEVGKLLTGAATHEKLIFSVAEPELQGVAM